MSKIKINLNQKFHFVGIGGIGMSGLAQIMKNMGFKIQGSDILSNKNVERCRKIGIKVFRSHKKENIKNTSILIKSSAIKNNNPEIKAAKEKKISILKRAEMLAHVVSLKTNIVVSGSHGKTTTTSLISNILSSAKFDPTIINGGIINSFNSNARLGKGNWAVLEADESDGSFLNFPINYSVITNIDKEHMEFYKKFDNLKKSFLKFLNKTPLIGKSFVCIDDYEIKKLINKVKNKNFYTYGFSKKSDFQAFNVRFKKKYSVFDLRLPIRGPKKIIVKNIKLNLIGAHNVLNSLAAVSLCLHIGIKMNIIKKSLKSFSGIQRRLTKVFQIKEREFYDDYAHHPTEIKSVLKSLKITSNERKIVSVFQPHRYSRLRLLNKDFSSSFKDSDLVILCPVYAAGEKIDRKYNPFDFAKSITRDSNVQVVLVNNQKDLKNFFIKNLIENEIVVCMGAGSISKWLREMKF